MTTQVIDDPYKGERFVYFDIETIPDQSPGALEKATKSVKPPANLKKPESIEKWWAEKSDDAANDAWEKTSFDGGLGHVCTISWAKNDGEIKTHHLSDIADEYEVIAAFFDDLDPYHSERLVGHYIAGFDIPFLIKRAIVLGVPLPPASSFPRDPKPWDKNIHDTMYMWAGAKGSIKMDALCDIFGIPGKGDFDGSMVADAWANGEHQTISEYCADDVRRTREIHKRFLKAGW